ncbi:MAG: EAL domain-containing protein [Eubacterium sp.]|nr:EAL domain-containing protein [Eubacterium sp.]
MENIQADLALHITALLLSLTCLVFTLIQKRTDRYQNVAYMVLLVIVIINSCTEAILDLVGRDIQVDDTAFLVACICSYLYFIIHTALAPGFFYYELCVTGLIRKVKDRRFLLYMAFFIFMEILAISQPFTSWVFYYDEARVFHRGWAEVVIYVISALYIAVSVISLIRTWRAITSRKKLSIAYFLTIVLAGILIQMFIPSLKAELFAESLAMLGLMLTVESEDDSINPDIGIYNRKALMMDLNNYRGLGIPVTAVFVKVTDLDMMLKRTGSTNTDGFTEIMSMFLRTLVPRNYIYSTSPGQFVILVNEKHKDGDRKFMEKLLSRLEIKMSAEEIVNRVINRFDAEWLVGRSEILLDATVAIARMPEELSDASDILYIADSSVPRSLSGRLLKGDDLSFALRRMEVEKALIRGLREDEFEVYYQPTFYTEDFKLYGAEALLRLKDSVIGNVPPDEFIPVAEQMGLIDEISEFVLRDVCKFLASGVPQKFGMESINVNLSVLQCLKKDFAEKIKELVKSYKLSEGLVNFEITESVEPDDYEILSKVMGDLKKAGFHFSMDDYGTGYSNMQSSFSLDFDIVKIDKSILWAAEKNEFGCIVLENSINMIRKMDRKIVVEGVETKEQIEMLKKLKVEYLQGYYFSKPVPKDELIEILKN